MNQKLLLALLAHRRVLPPVEEVRLDPLEWARRKLSDAPAGVGCAVTAAPPRPSGSCSEGQPLDVPVLRWVR